MTEIPRHIRQKMKQYPLFYQRVWQICARIPLGEVRTYGWIASQLGNSGAARAVGRALAANPFAPLIPCHRVIRADGRLGGYSGVGGKKGKRFLLVAEQRLRKQT